MPERTLLITLHVLVELAPTAPADLLAAAQPIEEHLDAAITHVLGPVPPYLGVVSTVIQDSTRPDTNSGQCSICGAWVTDREQPTPVRGLPPGARVDGRLVCDEHLPPGHPWAF